MTAVWLVGALVVFAVVTFATRTLRVSVTARAGGDGGDGSGGDGGDGGGD